MIRRNLALLGLFAISLLPPALATPDDKPPAETPQQRDARLQWWRDARFGMFIHWGPVSIKGTEIGWSRGARIPIAEYDNLYKQFNPTKFNADEWVRIAKDAGMKYIVFTSKHHDGFCMFDTKQTDHNIMNSPFHRDVCKELSEACKRRASASAPITRSATGTILISRSPAPAARSSARSPTWTATTATSRPRSRS